MTTVEPFRFSAAVTRSGVLGREIRVVLVIAALALAVATLPALASGQDVSVRAWTNATEVGDDDLVTYALEVRGAPFGQVETPEPPSTTNLVLGRTTPTAGRATTYENGELVQSITFRWLFRPLNVGEAVIDPAQVTVAGRTLETEPIRIAVEPQASRSFRAAQPPRLRDEWAAPPSDEGLAEDDLMVRTVLDSDEVYANEQVNIEYQLLFRDFIRPGSSRLIENWEAEGLWREELNVDMRPTPEAVFHQGQRYSKITLMRASLFPMRPGTHVITPLVVRTDVNFAHPVRHSRSAPDDPVELRTDSLTIAARPVPAGAPNSFTGAVGRFELETRASRTEVQAGDAVEITARLKGSGNLALLDPPALEAPAGFTLYDPSTETELDRSGSRLRGAAEYTYTLIAHELGEHTIPPLEISYLDPQTGQYETLRGDSFTVTVDETTEPTVTQAPPPDVRTEDQGRRYSTLFAIAALLAGIVAFWGWKRYQDEDQPGVAAEDTSPAPLARARHAAQEGDVDGCYRALDQAVREAVANRSHQPALGQSRQKIARLLEKENVPDELARSIVQLLQEVEEARYAPPSERPAQMQESVNRASSIIEALATPEN